MSNMSECSGKRVLLKECVSVDENEITHLLKYYSRCSSNGNSEDEVFKHSVKKCINLLKCNYNLLTISNDYGNFTSRYPDQLVILQSERDCSPNTSASSSEGTSSTDTVYECVRSQDLHSFKGLLNKARFARCQMRFPIPVILYDKKYVCRSATLSGSKEVRHRSELYYIICPSQAPKKTLVGINKKVLNRRHKRKRLPDWQLLDYIRKQDIKLLETFNVGTIIDLMLEKTKDLLLCTERSDKEHRYVDFEIISLPYPRVTYFQEFRKNNYNAKNIVYGWSDDYIDKKIIIPPNILSVGYGINWNDYKKWDLIELTSNYLQLILKYLQVQDSGILIHCISGWDRTPLFISLVRMSLWADGLAHRGLDVHQLLYLTITYDWILFGHDLNARHNTGKDIFVFCFYMLKYLTDKKYSLLLREKRSVSHYNKSVTVKEPLCTVKAENVTHKYFLRKRPAVPTFDENSTRKRQKFSNDDTRNSSETLLSDTNSSFFEVLESSFNCRYSSDSSNSNENKNYNNESRKEKLNNLRSLFYTCFESGIGFQYKK